MHGIVGQAWVSVTYMCSDCAWWAGDDRKEAHLDDGLRRIQTCPRLSLLANHGYGREQYFLCQLWQFYLSNLWGKLVHPASTTYAHSLCKSDALVLHPQSCPILALQRTLMLIYDLAAAVPFCGVGIRQQTSIKPVHSLAPRIICPSTNTHMHAHTHTYIRSPHTPILH